MERDSASGQFQQGEILDNDGVGSGLFNTEHHFMDVFQLAVEDDGVESYEDPRPVSVGVGTQCPDIFNAVSGGLSGSECRPGNIYGIGTAVDGRDADIHIPCRSKKFQEFHSELFPEG